MPKMKTHRGAAKRFSFTAKGKVKVNRSGRRHILTSKPTARKRVLRKSVIASGPDSAVIKKMLPYG